MVYWYEYTFYYEEIMAGLTNTVSEGLGRYSIGEKRPGLQDVPYYFECLDYRATERKLSAFLADFREMAPEKVKPHQHAGVEFLFVIKGSLTLKIGGDEFHLEPEDAIYFDSAAQHSY